MLMSTKIQFDVGMDNKEFMSSSKDIARAINSLKSTVAQAGKSMNSSAMGYGNAMRASIKATQEYESRIQAIKAQLATLKNSASAIKAAADSFTTLKTNIKNTEKELDELQAKMKALADAGQGAASPAWEQNQAAIAKTTADVEKYTSDLAKATQQYEYYQKLVSTGQTQYGVQLNASEIEDAERWVKIYSGRIDDAKISLDAANEQLKELKTTQEELATKGENGPSKEYMETEDAISKANSELNTMRAQLKQMENSGVDKASDEYLRQTDRIKTLEAALQQMEQIKERAFKPPYLQSWEQMTRLSGLVSEGFGRLQNAASGALYAITHPIQAADRALGTLIVKTGQMISAFARMAGSAALSFLRNLASTATNAAIQLARIVSNAVISGLSSLANSARNAVVSLARLATNTAASALRSIASAAGSAATSLARLAKTAITTGFQKLASGAAAAGKGILGLIKHNNNASQSFKRSFTTILKYAFGVRSMYFLFRRLRTAVKDAFTEMAKSVPEVNSAIRSLQTALGGLKGSLASAFAPIFTAVAPALVYLINMLTAAMNTLGAFFAALTGKGAFKKAVGAAKSAGGGAGKAAKSAKKEVKDLKRELMGFDELNILSGDNDNSDAGGGGGGGGGAGAGFKFVDEKVPDEIKKFVDTLKELWKNGEYEKIGRLLGKQVNKLFKKAYEAVKWENVIKKWKKRFDAITGIFNGLIYGIDWDLIGRTFAEGINTLLESINYMLTHIDFGAAGQAFAVGLNGLFSRGDLFSKAAEALYNALKGAINFGKMFLDYFDEGKVAESIRNALETGLPWDSIAKDTWEVIKTAFNKAGNFLNVLLGGGDEEMPDISKFTRKRPETIKPKFTVDDSVWDEVAANLANGFNTVVDKLTAAINSHDAGSVVHALAGWIVKLKNGIKWENVGILIGVAFRKVLDGIGAIIDEWGADADTLGTQIAGAINGFIDAAFDGDEIATKFNTAVKGAFSFLKAFTEKLDEENLATELRKAITGINWPGIAHAVWEAFKSALNKAGNFIDILLGGNTKQDMPDTLFRKKPENITPKITIDESVWNDIGQRLIDGFNIAVGKLTDFINGNQGTVQTGVAAFTRWIGAVFAGIEWDTVAAAIGALFKMALTSAGTLIAGFAADADEMGKKLFRFLSLAIGSIEWFGDSDTSVQGIITNLFKAAVGLVKGFFDDFNAIEFAKNLREKLKDVDWAGIARSIWDSISKELSKLGDIISILLGGDTANTNAADKLMRKRSGGYSEGQRVWENKGGAAGLADVIGKAVSAAITQLDKWITSIDWETVGAGLHEFLVNLPWGEWGEKLATALTDLFNSIREFFAGLIFGEEGGEKFLHYQSGDTTYGGKQYQKAQSGDVSQEFYDKYAELSRQINQYIENSILSGAFALNIAQALDISGWDELSAEAQYAYFLALQDSFGSTETYDYLIKQGKDLTGALGTGIKQGDIGVSENDAGNLVVTLLDGTQKTINKDGQRIQELFAELGVDSVAGLVQAFGEQQTTADDASEQLMQGVVDTANEAVDTGSPSKVFEELGNNIVDGLILGLGTLPQQLQTIWNALPEWAKTMFASLGKTLGIDISANGGDNVGDNTGGQPAVVEDSGKSSKVTKKEIKETQKNTKELKKNTEKRSEVDVNYEGAGFDTSGDTPKLNVGVQFAPEGEEPTDENTNQGLLGWLQALLDADTVEAKVALIRDGWENFKSFLAKYGVDENSTIGTLIKLLRDNFDDFMSWLGIDPSSPIAALIKLLLDNAESLLDFLGIDQNTPIETVIKLVLNKFKDLMDFLGIPEDSILRTIVDLLMGETDPDVEKALEIDGTTIEAFIKLIKKGFDSFLEFLGIETDNPIIETLIELVKNNWTTIDDFIGTAVSVLVSLTKNGFKTVGDVIGTALTVFYSLTKSDNSQTLAAKIGTLLGVYYTLDRKDGNQTLANKIGTALNILYTLNRKDNSQTLASKIGTALNVLYTLSKKDNNQTLTSKIGTALNVLYTLSKHDNNQTLTSKIGTALTVAYSLTKHDKNQTLAAKIGTSLSVAVSLSTSNLSSWVKSVTTAINNALKKIKGKAGGGAITSSGKEIDFASGGIIRGGMAKYLSNVPHYAAGTSKAHGTVFVAGEAGPEIMGHINGRTEILNKSQLAEAMYGAVVRGMAAAVNALGAYIGNRMTICSNAIIETIGNGVEYLGMNFYSPAVATGGIMPYDVAMQIARSTQELQNTLDANNEDLIQALVSAMGNAANVIVSAMQRNAYQNNINRSGMTTGQGIDDINRTTLMFGKSPLKGV